MYGGGFDLAAALAAKVLPFTVFETRRLVGAAVGLIGLVATWRTGRRIGGPLAGLLALVLLATCPLYVGHSFMNAKDAPFAVAMALLLLGLVRAFEQYPRLPVATGALTGVGFGLAIGSRIMGGFGAVYGLCALALVFAVEARADGLRAAGARLGRFVLLLLPYLVLAYAVMALVWPWSVADPLNPLRALSYFSHFFEKPWSELFGGELILVTDMPRSYVPTLLALQLPEIFSVLATRRRRRRADRGGATRRRAEPPRGVPAGRARRRPADRGHDPGAAGDVQRHPAFRVRLAAARRARRSRGRAASPAFCRNADAWRQLSPASSSPPASRCRSSRWCGCTPTNTPISTASPAASRGARDRYMLDYWGLSFKQASHGLAAKLAELKLTRPADRRWKLAVCGPHRSPQVELGPDFETTWDPQGADFAMMLGEFYCATSTRRCWSRSCARASSMPASTTFAAARIRASWSCRSRERGRIVFDDPTTTELPSVP